MEGATQQAHVGAHPWEQELCGLGGDVQVTAAVVKLEGGWIMS